MSKRTPNTRAESERPVVVLVHGAFADTSSWNGVIQRLESDGIHAIAAANPLRSLAGDADYVGRLVASIDAPVVLVGHSYGGSVISEAAAVRTNVEALVYVAAFAPDAGETSFGLTDKFPGSTLGQAVAPPVKLADGSEDLYIEIAKFAEQFAADVPEAAARLMAAGQRPIAKAAGEGAVTHPAWKGLPSWFIYGDADRNIPPQAHAFMARRAQSRQTVAIKAARIWSWCPIRTLSRAWSRQPPWARARGHKSLWPLPCRGPPHQAYGSALMLLRSPRRDYAGPHQSIYDTIV